MSSNYLTIEEVARKLGRMPSWVKEQICEGNIDATLSGNRWLISIQTFEMLRSSSPPVEASNTVHNFLPKCPPKKQKSKPPQRSLQNRKPPEPSGKPHNYTAASRKQSGKDKRPTLTQRIRTLDGEFDRLTTELKIAMKGKQTPTRVGSKSKEADDLLKEWKKVKLELQHLLRIAHTKGLRLPANLNISRILGQKSRTTDQKGGRDDKWTAVKRPVVVKGIDGYSGGPRHAGSHQDTTRPAEIEAQLIILRNRERAAAHDMQDRAKGSAAREAAGIKWAQARRAAEALERDLKNTRPGTRDLKSGS